MEKVIIYDPFVKSYREVDIEVAKKFVESCKKVEQQLKKLEENKNEK